MLKASAQDDQRARIWRPAPGWALDLLALLSAGHVTFVMWGDWFRASDPFLASVAVRAAPLFPAGSLLGAKRLSPATRKWLRLSSAGLLTFCSAVSYEIGGLAYLAGVVPLLLGAFVATQRHHVRALFVLGVLCVLAGVLMFMSYGGIFLPVGLPLAFGAGGYIRGSRRA